MAEAGFGLRVLNLKLSNPNPQPSASVLPTAIECSGEIHPRAQGDVPKVHGSPPRAPKARCELPG